MTAQKPKILIVDDDSSIGLILKAGLEMHGFAARFESRSADAIPACLEFQPDLLLLDVNMPGKDGGQVASELRSHPTLGRTPVIFLTSLVTKGEAEQNVSGETFLAKPIPMTELVAKIRGVLHPWTPR